MAGLTKEEMEMENELSGVKELIRARHLAEARAKLVSALPYVLAVERVLIEDVKIQPVLTS